MVATKYKREIAAARERMAHGLVETAENITESAKGLSGPAHPAAARLASVGCAPPPTSRLTRPSPPSPATASPARIPDSRAAALVFDRIMGKVPTPIDVELRHVIEEATAGQDAPPGFSKNTYRPNTSRLSTSILSESRAIVAARLPSSEPLTPVNFTPRHYQRLFLDALAAGLSRGIPAGHRRAGKKRCKAWATRGCSTRPACAAATTSTCSPPTPRRRRRCGTSSTRPAFHPGTLPALLAGERPQRERDAADPRNGSTVQLAGMSTYDRLDGANPVGVVFSEFSLTNPRAWDQVLPSSPRTAAGRCSMARRAARTTSRRCTTWRRTIPLGTSRSKRWMTPRRWTSTPRARRGMSEDLIRQEFYCGFPGGQRGRLLRSAHRPGARRGPHQPRPLSAERPGAYGVGLGHRRLDGHLVLPRRRSRAPLYRLLRGERRYSPHYAKVLQDRGYVYGQHYAPHDAAARESWGRARAVEIAEELEPGSRSSRRTAWRTRLKRCGVSRCSAVRRRGASRASRPPRSQDL